MSKGKCINCKHCSKLKNNKHLCKVSFEGTTSLELRNINIFKEEYCGCFK